VGWIRRQANPSLIILPPQAILDNTISVNIEMADGRWQTLENYITSDQYYLGSGALSPHLKVLAWITPFPYGGISSRFNQDSPRIPGEFLEYSSTITVSYWIIALD
jgi:hypothetical protein